MILTGANLTRDELGGGTFSLTFEEITIVSTASVKAPEAKEKRGVPALAKGAQSTKPVPPTDSSAALKAGLSTLKALGLE